MIQPTLVNLHPNELAQSLLYYPFAVDLDRCMGSCNTLNNLSNRLCVPEKTEDLDMNFFNMITGINVKITITKKLTKHISCKWGCNLIVKNGIMESKSQIKNGIMKHANVNEKTIKCAKKIIAGILVHAFVRMISI